MFLEYIMVIAEIMETVERCSEVNCFYELIEGMTRGPNSREQREHVCLYCIISSDRYDLISKKENPNP